MLGYQPIHGLRILCLCLCNQEAHADNIADAVD